jgi:hypothetical protein
MCTLFKGTLTIKINKAILLGQSLEQSHVSTVASRRRKLAGKVQDENPETQPGSFTETFPHLCRKYLESPERSTRPTVPTFPRFCQPRKYKL